MPSFSRLLPSWASSHPCQELNIRAYYLRLTTLRPLCTSVFLFRNAAQATSCSILRFRHDSPATTLFEFVRPVDRQPQPKYEGGASDGCHDHDVENAETVGEVPRQNPAGYRASVEKCVEPVRRLRIHSLGDGVGGYVGVRDENGKFHQKNGNCGNGILGV